MRSFVTITGLLFSAAMLVGCQGAAVTLNAPKAKVQSVEVTERSDEGSRVLTTVAVENPNAVVLPLIKASYTVDVEGAGRFRFTEVPGRALPGEGTQRLDLPAAFASDESLRGRGYDVTGAVTYRPPGEVESILYQSGFPLPSTRFRASGRFE